MHSFASLSFPLRTSSPEIYSNNTDRFYNREKIAENNPRVWLSSTLLRVLCACADS